MLWAWLASFSIGFLASVLTTLCWIAIADRKAWTAALWEALTIGITIGAWQLWAALDNDWKILAIEGLGTVAGTWLTVIRSK